MNIVFKRETVAGLWDEVMPLLEDHYLEIAHYKDIPFDPDKGRYLAAEKVGAVLVFTARDDEKLMGYNVFFVANNAHYKDSLQATQDILYLAPEYRGKMTGVRFIRWCDNELEDLGVEVVYQHVKARPELNFGPMLERIGYELVDLIYTKRLRPRTGE